MIPAPWRDRFRLAALAAVAFVLAHDLVFLLTDGGSYGLALARTGHGDQWTGTVIVVAALAAGLAIAGAAPPDHACPGSPASSTRRPRRATKAGWPTWPVTCSGPGCVILPIALVAVRRRREPRARLGRPAGARPDACSVRPSTTRSSAVFVAGLAAGRPGRCPVSLATGPARRPDRGRPGAPRPPAGPDRPPRPAVGRPAPCRRSPATGSPGGLPRALSPSPSPGPARTSRRDPAASRDAAAVGPGNPACPLEDPHESASIPASRHRHVLRRSIRACSWWRASPTPTS